MWKVKEKLFDNRKRHIAFRDYYWEAQTESICKISIIFLFVCILGVIMVPIEHARYPQLGYLKYGISVCGHLVAAIFAKWLLVTKKISDTKKPFVSEIFSVVLGFLYLLWGILSMEISMYESGTIVILMYLILLAVITAFWYYPSYYYQLLILVSYVLAGICFVKHSDLIMDISSQICAVIFALVLYSLGRTRYIYGRDKYEMELKNIKLMDELSAHNEELNASNQSLFDMNEKLNSMNEQLEEALEEIEKSAEAQKMFTSSMNHELRAPLNGIIGNIQIMQMNDKLSDEDKETLNQCMAMSKSLLSIVNDLLDFAKMDAGEFEILPAAFDLHDVMKSTSGMFKNVAESKGLELKIDIADDTICGLYGDDFRIQQVINNIVSNAVKYTDEGEVTIRASYMDEKLTFVISDTGQGISEESIEDLFKPFKRIAEFKNKKIQGTGLGMTIVMKLISQMQGTIDVQSTIGKGTTFTVVIPSKVTDADNTWGNEKKEVSTNNQNVELRNLEGTKILYVDDTKINLKIIGKLLSDTNVAVVGTTEPLEGLEKAKEEKFDIIILDHQMPNISGPELFDMIKNESDVNRDTPVIIFTGNAGVGVAEKYKEMGFAGYLSKPVLKDKLLELIYEYVID